MTESIYGTFPPAITRANITHTPTFLKLTEQAFGEIIINTSAITFISIDTCKIYIRNTDIHGNGMLNLTEDSMKKLLSALGCDEDAQ